MGLGAESCTGFENEYLFGTETSYLDIENTLFWPLETIVEGNFMHDSNNFWKCKSCNWVA